MVNRIPTDMIEDRTSGQKLSEQLAENAKVKNNYITLAMYGGVADAKYQDPVTHEWYTDSNKSKLATDNTNALISAIADIQNSKDWTLFIDGVYCIRGTKINVSHSSFRIKGQGLNTSMLAFTHPDGGLYFNNTGGNGYIYEIHFRDIAFTGSYTCKTPLSGLKCEQFSMHNAYVGQTADSVMVWEELNLTNIVRFQTSDCVKGIVLKNCGYVSFYNHNFYNMSGYVIKILDGINILNIYDGWAETFDTFLKIEADRDSSVGTLNIENNKFNSISLNPLLLDINVPDTFALSAININFNRNQLTFTQSKNIVNVSNKHSGTQVILKMHDNYFLLTGDYNLNKLVNTNVNAAYNFIFVFDGTASFLGANNINGLGQEVGINTVNGLVRPKGGIYLNDDPTSLQGHIKYDVANKRLLMRDQETASYQFIPIRGEWIAPSTATDIATLKNDYNNLLTILKNAFVIQ